MTGGEWSDNLFEDEAAAEGGLVEAAHGFHGAVDGFGGSLHWWNRRELSCLKDHRNFVIGN